jgi:hypothetical protein
MAQVLRRLQQGLESAEHQRFVIQLAGRGENRGA